MNWSIRKSHLSFESLTSLSVPHAITTREWESLNPFVGYQGLTRLESGIAVSDGSSAGTHVVFAEQVHGADIHRCVVTDAGSIRFSVDGLVSTTPEVLLAVYVADCFPILMYDRAAGSVGAIHAGRRGLIAGVIQSAVSRLEDMSNGSPDIYVGIGPGLRVCCYEIQSDIFPELDEAGWSDYVEERDSKYYLDISRACLNILLSSGISLDRIEDMNICTACRGDLLYSSRRRTQSDERGASFAGLIACPARS